MHFRRPAAKPSPAAAAAAAERLYAAGQYGPALAAYLDAAEQTQRTRLRRPADEPEPTAVLALLLVGAGRCYGKLRRFDEAVGALVGAQDAAEELVEADAARWGPLLAAVLEPLAGAYGETGRWDDALAVSRRAVELRRGPSTAHDLAVSLRVFAHVRATAGRELPEALQAVSEAMTCHLAFAAELPDRSAYQSQITATQQIQTLVVSRMGPRRRRPRA